MGLDVRELLQKPQINDDIFRLEKLLFYANNDVAKIKLLFSNNILSCTYEEFTRLIDVYLPNFKQLPVSNVKPNYFSQPNRVFDDINMQHIMDKHTVEHFDFDENGIGKDIDMFPIGTTQQQVAAYIDEALTILKNTKGDIYPINGNAETIILSNGIKVIIGSNMGSEIGIGNFPHNQNIIGQFYPTGNTGLVIKASILKIVNAILN